MKLEPYIGKEKNELTRIETIPNQNQIKKHENNNNK